jgi:predicted transcriptional regulator
MKYRSRADIIAMILQSANKGATKTRLMYGAYLSYTMTQEYLVFLQKKGLILYEEEVQKYRLTEKGLQFLRCYDQISDVLDIERPSIPQRMKVSITTS